MLDPGWRVWRPQTFEGRHYIIGYRCHGQEWAFSPELEGMIPQADSIEMFESASLFSSGDGLGWSKVSDIAAEDNDETDFDFSPDGRILAVSRKGASSRLHPGARPGSRHAIAYLGHPPYRSWRRLPLDRMIQAPAVRWARDRWMVAGRYIDGETEQVHPHRADYPHKAQRYGTRLWTLEDRTGALTQAVTLPSWGDCSYPGMIEDANGDLAGGLLFPLDHYRRPSVHRRRAVGGQDASLIDLSGPSGQGRYGLEGCRYVVRIVCLS